MVGLNDERFGERFFSRRMPTMRNTAHCYKKWRKKRGPSDGGRVRLVSGAEFRDCGEIRMMQIIGGDVVGMSVVPGLFQLAIANLKSLRSLRLPTGGRSE